MTTLEEVILEIIKFRNDRDWEQFHNSKDLALAISIEVSELNQLFLWKGPKDVNETKLAEEVADILIYILLLAHKHNLDIPEIIHNKLKTNAIKYPVNKAKGSSKKYNEL